MRQWPGNPSGPAGSGYDVAVVTVAAGVVLGVLIALLLRNLALGLAVGVALALLAGPVRDRLRPGPRRRGPQPGGREPEATSGRPSAGDPW